MLQAAAPVCAKLMPATGKVKAETHVVYPPVQAVVAGAQQIQIERNNGIEAAVNLCPPARSLSPPPFLQRP
jgi:hypothetical protein